ncbi:ferredoxin reductase family protein [Leifsonia poae]|uniref:Ferric reductase n=1 Tax=Leifsonia poae TaxID=110933 RepID=A0A9W6HBD1_9MICO|nr:ferric reductase [Leifsonia poae]
MSAVTAPRHAGDAASVAAHRRHSRLVRVVIAAGMVAVLGVWWTSVPVGYAATPADLATTLGELAGLVGAYLVCAQLLLIARVPWFERAVGLDKLVAWHRSLGATVVFLVLAHIAFMVLGAEILDKSLPWTEFIVMLQDYPDMLTALIGTILFLLVGLTSARLLRRALSYEVWYWIHLTAYVGIFLTFFHQLSGGAHFVSNPLNRALWLLLYLGTAAAIITWRFVLPTLDAWRYRMRVEGVVHETADTASVWFRGKNLERLGVRAGNFLNFRFLTWGHLLTAHPYSVSFVPRDGLMRITVGGLGDHSRLLRNIRPGTRVFAEGPFGHFTADRASRQRILLVAGGAGVGPIRALAEELQARGAQPVVLYRAHSDAHLALLGELQAMPAVAVVPVVGRRSDLGYDPLSADVLRTFIPDLHNWEVFVCGPEGMADTVEDSLRQLHVPKRFVHREELSMS